MLMLSVLMIALYAWETTPTFVFLDAGWTTGNIEGIKQPQSSTLH